MCHPCCASFASLRAHEGQHNRLHWIPTSAPSVLSSDHMNSESSDLCYTYESVSLEAVRVVSYYRCSDACGGSAHKCHERFACVLQIDHARMSTWCSFHGARPAFCAHLVCLLGRVYVLSESFALSWFESVVLGCRMHCAIMLELLCCCSWNTPTCLLLEIPGFC